MFPFAFAYASAMDLGRGRVVRGRGTRARAYDADGAALVEAEARTIDLTGERLHARTPNPAAIARANPRDG